MKKTSAEYRERTVVELERLEGELTRELWKARFDNFTNQLDNTSKIGRSRRNLARVKTILTEKKRASAAGQSKE
jgi:large subunit ribosomal protein L29